jgi:hypothetical protein
MQFGCEAWLARWEAADEQVKSGEPRSYLPPKV